MLGGGHNHQKYTTLAFIAVQDKDRLKQLSELGNWAGHLAGAAFGVAIVTPDPEQRFSIMFDAGQAAGYMQLLGLGAWGSVHALQASMSLTKHVICWDFQPICICA
jgi:hypothetical protein